MSSRSKFETEAKPSRKILDRGPTYRLQTLGDNLLVWLDGGVITLHQSFSPIRGQSNIWIQDQLMKWPTGRNNSKQILMKLFYLKNVILYTALRVCWWIPYQHCRQCYRSPDKQLSRRLTRMTIFWKGEMYYQRLLIWVSRQGGKVSKLLPSTVPRPWEGSRISLCSPKLHKTGSQRLIRSLRNKRTAVIRVQVSQKRMAVNHVL